MGSDLKLMTLAQLSSFILEYTVAINTTVLPLWRDAKNAKDHFKPSSDKNRSTTSSYMTGLFNRTCV